MIRHYSYPHHHRGHEESSDAEGDEVGREEHGIGTGLLNGAEHGDGAFPQPSRIEHIEGVPLGKSKGVGGLVEGESDEIQGDIHQSGLPCRLPLGLDFPREPKIEAEQEHGAVPDHGVDVQKDDLGEHRSGGIEQDRRPRHGRISGQEAQEGLPDFPLGQKGGDQRHVDGDGAELEGEFLPVVDPTDGGVVTAHQLLSYLKEQQTEGKERQGALYRLVGFGQIFIENQHEQKQPQDDTQSCQVKAAEGLRGHREARGIGEYFFKQCYGGHILASFRRVVNCCW